MSIPGWLIWRATRICRAMCSDRAGTNTGPPAYAVLIGLTLAAAFASPAKALGEVEIGAPLLLRLPSLGTSSPPEAECISLLPARHQDTPEHQWSTLSLRLEQQPGRHRSSSSARSRSRSPWPPFSYASIAGGMSNATICCDQRSINTKPIDKRASFAIKGAKLR